MIRSHSGVMGWTLNMYRRLYSASGLNVYKGKTLLEKTRKKQWHLRTYNFMSCTKDLPFLHTLSCPTWHSIYIVTMLCATACTMYNVAASILIYVMYKWISYTHIIRWQWVNNYLYSLGVCCNLFSIFFFYLVKIKNEVLNMVYLIFGQPQVWHTIWSLSRVKLLSSIHSNMNNWIVSWLN